MRRTVIAALISAVVVAFAAALLIAISALRYNMQCEVHCDGQTDWNYLFAIFGSWFLILLPVGFAISALGCLLLRRSA